MQKRKYSIHAVLQLQSVSLVSNKDSGRYNYISIGRYNYISIGRYDYISVGNYNYISIDRYDNNQLVWL